MAEAEVLAPTITAPSLEVAEAVEDVLKRIKDRDVRRILRTLHNFCKRLGGTGKLVEVAPDSDYKYTCWFGSEMPLQIGFGSLALGGGVLRLRSTKESYISIPSAWSVNIEATEKAVGFEASVEKPIVGAAEWSLWIKPLKSKPAY